MATRLAMDEETPRFLTQDTASIGQEPGAER
jgi:hypothetical protein